MAQHSSASPAQRSLLARHHSWEVVFCFLMMRLAFVSCRPMLAELKVGGRRIPINIVFRSALFLYALSISLETPPPVMKQDFARYHETCAIRGFDVLHQLGRLRLSKNVPDVEMEAIARAIADNLKSYEQVIEVSDLNLSICDRTGNYSASCWLTCHLTGEGSCISAWGCSINKNPSEIVLLIFSANSVVIR